MNYPNTHHIPLDIVLFTALVPLILSDNSTGFLNPKDIKFDERKIVPKDIILVYKVG